LRSAQSTYSIGNLTNQSKLSHSRSSINTVTLGRCQSKLSLENPIDHSNLRFQEEIRQELDALYYGTDYDEDGVDDLDDENNNNDDNDDDFELNNNTKIIDETIETKLEKSYSNMSKDSGLYGVGINSSGGTSLNGNESNSYLSEYNAKTKVDNYLLTNAIKSTNSSSVSTASSNNEAETELTEDADADEYCFNSPNSNHSNDLDETGRGTDEDDLDVVCINNNSNNNNNNNNGNTENDHKWLTSSPKKKDDQNTKNQNKNNSPVNCLTKFRKFEEEFNLEVINKNENKIVDFKSIRQNRINNNNNNKLIDEIDSGSKKKQLTQSTGSNSTPSQSSSLSGSGSGSQIASPPSSLSIINVPSSYLSDQTSTLSSLNENNNNNNEIDFHQQKHQMNTPFSFSSLMNTSSIMNASMLDNINITNNLNPDNSDTENLNSLSILTFN
jgi:hypothetical protein